MKIKERNKLYAGDVGYEDYSLLPLFGGGDEPIGQSVAGMVADGNSQVPVGTFHGPHFDHKRDSKRLASQSARIFKALVDAGEEEWLSVIEIQERVEGICIPENSIQAQVRSLRGERIGRLLGFNHGLDIKGRYRKNKAGIQQHYFEYAYFPR